MTRAWIRKADVARARRAWRCCSARRRGDRGALPALYDRTSAKLYGICLRLLGNEAEAQDALQEVYVTVWRKAARFDPAKASADHLAGRACAQQGDRPAARRRNPAERSTRLRTLPTHSPSAFDVVEQCAGRGATGRLPRRAGGARARDDPRAHSSTARPIPSWPSARVPLRTMKSWIRRGLLRLRGCLEQ